MKKVLTHLDMGNVAKLKNLPNATQPDEAVNLSQLNDAIEGLAPKDSVRVATQSNINLSSPGASIDGITLAGNDRVLVKAQTLPEENGIYIFNGASVAMTRALDANTSNELEQAVVSVEEGTDENTTWRQTSVNFVLETGSVQFIPFGTSTPDASTTVKGKIEIATQAEVDTGTDSTRAVTPETLANWQGRIKKFSTLIGDASGTQFDVTHNFNTRDVEVKVYKNSSPYDEVIVDVESFDVNTSRIRFAAAPALNEYKVVVIG